MRENRGISVWAFILIAVGVIWLLGEANILSMANFAVLARFWPLILIGIGVAMLVGRGNRVVANMVGLGTIAVLVGLMLIGPSLGLAESVEVKTAAYSEPLNGAEAARVHLQVAMGQMTLRPLTDSNNLMEADIRYLGEIAYTSTDEGGVPVLDLKNEYQSGFDMGSVFTALVNNEELNWTVGLNPAAALDLSISTGTGSTNLDLSDFQLTDLYLNTGTGSVNLTLPSSDAEYSTVISTGTGTMDINIEEGAAVDLRINSGTGSVTIDVPEGAAVRLVGDTGTGSINVSSDFERISGGGDENFIGDSGTWETANYDTATRKITIDFSGGTGGLNIR